MARSFAMNTETTGSGRPVVLVPGGLTGWLSWKPHAERLSADCRVTRVQLLNVDMGLKGERLPDEYGVGLEVQGLVSALDREGIGEADFAAWSFGAEVTLSFAMAHPKRVRTLTLIEPPAIWVLRSRGPLSPELLDQQKQLAAMWRVDVTEDQLAWFTHFAGFVPKGVDPKSLPPWPGWLAHRQSLAHGDAPYLHEDDISRVRKFPKPVLLFKSRDSSGFLIRIVDILGAEFPGAVVHDLPGGHALHVVGMEDFFRIFLPFIGGA
jgi:pimeloyl-ACP methyl ester carboxylesterase